jgi:predicted enzyme related to lactoylglutathione lyase
VSRPIAEASAGTTTRTVMEKPALGNRPLLMRNRLSTAGASVHPCAMTSLVENIAFDCADTYALGQFWSQVVGHPLSDEDKPGDPEAMIALPNGTNLFFNQVPEPKTVKNRLHLCLSPDGPRDAEIERLLGLGATLVDDRRRPDGRGWAVLADPEGNEFCVLRPAAERAESNAGAAPA